jgi:hypothetical protein
MVGHLNNFKLFKIVLLSFCTINMIVSCASSQPGPQSTKSSQQQQAIPYTGVGTNLEDAKNDAIRSALSVQIPQYVFADRKVVNSRLELDSTISTMSGYITSFEIIDQYEDKDGFIIVTALIKVSERGIKDYAATRFEVISANKKSDTFDGKNIAGQVMAAKRQKEAEKARKNQQYITSKKLAERLFAGYPFNVIEVNITDINFDSDNPEKIMVGMSYDLNEEWRKSFWKKIELIDSLLTDSGEKENIEICANSGSVLDGCKRIPIINLSFIDDEPALQYSIVVPVFGPKGEYESCFYKDIPPVIGVLSEGDFVSGTAGDLAVGVGALAGYTGGAVGAIALGTAAVAVMLPFAVIGAVVSPDNGESSIEYTEPVLEWREPAKKIHVLGPNPFSTDFKAGNFKPRLEWWSGSSSLLYSERKAASEFLPFVIARDRIKIHFDGSEASYKGMPKMYGSSSLLSSKYYYGSWSKSVPTELCKKGGINRK